MSVLRLTESNLRARRRGIAAPEYDRSNVTTGIVHFGPGGFFRAHTAWHIDRILARDPRFGVSAISLKTAGSVQSLAAQDYLYTLVELDAEPSYRIIGALRESIVAQETPQRVFQRLIDRTVKVITITVTEKGYCLDGAGALDIVHPDIAHDLADPHAPQSLIGWLAEGLRRRHAAGVNAPTVMSCDNLVRNGPKLRQAVLDFVEARGDRAHARWIEDEVRFPATMVDSITPRADDKFLAATAEATGLRDEAAVRRERFTQWVVEDVLPSDCPDLASVGVTLTKNVRDYELAKLRLLNGAHSALAYLGLAAGHTTVFEAMSDTKLAAFVEAMMREDVTRTLKVAFDVRTYIDQIIARFRKPAIAHQLRQIAADGSMKLPYRILSAIADLVNRNEDLGRLPVPVAAWMRFVVTETRAGRMLEDPLANRLAEIGKAARDDASDVPRFLALKNVFPSVLRMEPGFSAALTSTYQGLIAQR